MGTNGASDVGIWGRYAGTRRSLVRRSYDVYRAVERGVNPRLGSVPSAFGAGRLYSEVEVEEPLVALTFDDGPDPDNTPRLLEILRERNVRASFYLIGELVSRYPEVAQSTLEAGHEIGNHTWSHRFLTLLSTRRIDDELLRTHEAIEGAIGSAPVALRPPFGATTPALTRWVDHRFGYPTINWSVDASDWDRPDPGTIRDRFLSATEPGSIVLAHDPVTSTVDAMPETIDRLTERGFRFVTVSELIAAETRSAETPSG
jgi:peptidoglycan-N-acetylglucosamine deacetylase